MKRIGLLTLILSFAIGITFAQAQILLIDDFEGVISGSPEGTVDFGGGNGSTINVVASTDIKQSGKQSIKITFDAVLNGYIWIARGSGLDVKNAGWLVKSEDIKWNDFNAVSFYMYGADSKTRVAFDVKDNGNEIWRFMAEDNFKGWKQIVCPFKDFVLRDDWQPDSTDKNGTLDFPIKSYQFEPRPEAKGTLYFDQVELKP